jgi:serine protease Do
MNLRPILATALLCMNAVAIGGPTKKSTALSTQDLAAAVRRSVVVIECQGESEPVLGSGFYVDSGGMVATNAHVVTGCTDVIVRDDQGELPAIGRVVVLDDERDIAIVVLPQKGRRALRLAASSTVSQGQRVYAIGHPEGLEYTMSEGIVSAFRELPGGRLIQTTAPISPGSSGGPLVDSNGVVVGMTTLFLSQGQNLNFAVTTEGIREAITKAKRQVAAGAVTPAMSPKTAARVARALRKKKQYASASSLLDAALAENGADLDVLLEKAELAWDQRQLDDAERFTRKMLDIDPSFAPAHQCLGTILYARGDREGGCREERRALELNPDERYRAYASYTLYECEIHQDKTQLTQEQKEAAVRRALRYLEAALEWQEYSDRADIEVQRAVALKLLGKTKEASVSARRALRLQTITDQVRAVLKEYHLPRQEVRITSFGKSPSYDLVPVASGVVVNESSEPISFVRVLVECKDAGGNVVATGTSYVEPTALPAGESGSFEVLLKGPMGVPSDCTPKIVESAP